MHQSGKINFKMICQKGAFRKREILQNLTLNSRLCFIESVHENYQWKAHQPSKAPSMGVILVKNPCYSDEKFKQ